MKAASPIESALAKQLLDGRGPDGAWGYYPGHTARLEPTCWAMLALGACDALASAVPDLIRVADFLKGTARDDGLLVDSLGVPPNLASNGLAALTLAQHREMLNPPATSRLLAALHRVKGLALPQNDEVHQDNSLQGWPWIDGTFSWVAPTACCLLALKKTAAIEADVATGQRIDEAEQLLFDRVCDSGGWNYGNASVQGTHLRAYVPTTALGLLALQDRRDHPVVQKSLTYLEANQTSEVSGMALGLTLLCLRLYGQPAETVEALLYQQFKRTEFLGNMAILGLALYSLSADEHEAAAFRL